MEQAQKKKTSTPYSPAARQRMRACERGGQCIENAREGEFRERAVRLVVEHRDEYPSETAALTAIAGKSGCSPECLRAWVRQTQRDGGERPGPTSAEIARTKELVREMRELRQANEILRKGEPLKALQFAPSVTRQANCADVLFVDQGVTVHILDTLLTQIRNKGLILVCPLCQGGFPPLYLSSHSRVGGIGRYRGIFTGTKSGCAEEYTTSKHDGYSAAVAGGRAFRSNAAQVASRGARQGLASARC